jgi:hypothetical protein
MHSLITIALRSSWKKKIYSHKRKRRRNLGRNSGKNSLGSPAGRHPPLLEDRGCTPLKVYR